jgi:hypothetical protein
MEIRQRLINEIKTLPEQYLQAIGVIIKEFSVFASKPEATEAGKKRPVFGCAKGKMWIADDFDAPLEEMREYME